MVRSHYYKRLSINKSDTCTILINKPRNLIIKFSKIGPKPWTIYTCSIGYFVKNNLEKILLHFLILIAFGFFMNF